MTGRAFLTDDKGADAPRGAHDMTTGSDGETPREIDSAGLFDGRSEIIIVHKGGRYRLRITRQDKLILNK
ncbi:hypothetical protein VE25_16725 [Devosia geojensis]|uniref:Hemin uptake protein HemP n=1 Tax=Devosia geojensis TaxID=443610 RepID=A0A0F5FQ53_9HYPH|nr:hypothetical protein VE25_16725 [Devosia geojensis]